MAKVQFGGGVSNIQGSVAGNTFTRTKGGPALRNKVKPNNPATVAQLEQRSRMGRLSAAWRTLTDEQREAWGTDAKTFQKKGVCGNNIELTGHQNFVRVNSMREENGDDTAQATLPGIPEYLADLFGASSGLVLDISDSSISVPLGSGALENAQITIWTTGPRSAGIMANKGSMAKVKVKTLDATDITNGYVEIFTEYTAKYGALAGTAGKAITFSLRQYSEGNYTVPVFLKGVITE